MSLHHLYSRFRRDEAGATATEYALLIGLVAFLSITAWDGIGANVRKVFQAITAAIV